MQYILVVVISAFSMVVQYYADLYNVSYIFATTSSGSMIHWAAAFFVHVDLSLNVIYCLCTHSHIISHVTEDP